MADSSVSSPRRMLSLSKERASVSLLDPDEKASAFAVSEEHGPKPSEVYGFVGSISAVVATGLFQHTSMVMFVSMELNPRSSWKKRVLAKAC